MNPGLLDTRLNAWQPSSPDGLFGRTDLDWPGPPRAVWAQRVRFSGSEVQAGGEVTAVYRADFIVRWESPVAEKWRVEEQQGGDLWQVEAVEPNRRKGLKKLMCRKVNF